MQAEWAAAEAKSHQMTLNAVNQASRTFLELPLTKHARCQMNARRLSDEMVAIVMTYGRLARVRGAEIYAVGRKEIERYLAEGVDLSRCDGVQVVCNPNGPILTAYRNSDFRGLRPRRGRHYRLMHA